MAPRKPLPIQVFTLTEAKPTSLCHGCERLQGRNDDGTARCEAFDVIPAAIWSGRADHTASYDGDRGLTFSPLGEYGARILKSFTASLTETRQVTTALTEVLDTPDESRPATDPNKVSESLPAAPPEQVHAVIGIEGVPSGDRRMVEQGALTWRDLTPTPMGFLDKHTDAGGEQVIQLTRIERHGAEIHTWGHYLDTPAASEFRRLLESAERLGASWELDDVDIEIDWPDGQNEDLFAEPDLVRFTRARLIAAAYTPVPAFSQCFIEPISADVSAAVVASVSIAERIPVHPPLEWFANPRLTEATALHITDDGQVYGHLAQWGQCHIGFQGTCVTPPYEAAMDYFLTGELVTEDGSRVPVGQLTLTGGHADLGMDARATVAHYDHTGSAVADLNCGPDSVGIWVAGALRPGVTPEQVRVLMASPPSGDWRRINGDFRLVAALNVNVPGFPTTRARVAGGVQVSLVAAGVVWDQQHDPLDNVAELLAGRIGRDRRALAASLVARVHPEVTTAGCNCGKRRARPGATVSASAAPAKPAKVSYEVVTPGGQRTTESTLIGAIRASRKVGGRYRVVYP